MTDAGERQELLLVDALWNGDGFDGTTLLERDGDRLRVVPPPADGAPGVPARHLGGTLIPSLTDHHVHLGLVDAAALFAGGLTRVIDLGWVPSVAAAWPAAHRDAGPEVAIAGGLITAPGGYPARSGWAPAGAAVEVHDASGGRAAVRAQLALSASRIKITLNTDAGPTLDDGTLRAIVEEAHAAGVPVACHAQGSGQAARALAAGVDQLAHTPYAERVPDGVIADAVAAGMTWVSTLDINGWGDRTTAAHRFAFDNARRFLAAGGTILYGTDQGNGDLPAGVDARELQLLHDAGLTGAALVRSIAGGTNQAGAALVRNVAGGERTEVIGPRCAWLPTAPPADDAVLPSWLATARARFVRTL
ncbi:amidohydrolase family protein [Leifsonia sp. NPDC080035]|uniref:Amidohydrolase family protein n=1 Tax=Leifsonia sp. NPDC080035 TaxID=3143936 RepID=A0AAU7GCT1_9MICO